MHDRIGQALAECAAERGLGFDAVVRYCKHKVIIDTRISRDPRRSNNGGEYYFWLSVWPTDSQTVVVRKRSSYDGDWEPDYEPEPIGSGWKDIKARIRREARQLGIPIVHPQIPMRRIPC
jgi:hypothetical protein